MTKSLKTRFKTDFTDKYARKQLKLALVHKHRHTKLNCETTAIEINHTSTKCDLFYMANHEIIIAALGFHGVPYNFNLFHIEIFAQARKVVFSQQEVHRPSV